MSKQVSGVITWIKTFLDDVYQSKLVSGTNIKTINNNSLLGSGNISIGGGGGLSIDDIYPVGSIYMTVDSTKNPNNLFTGTTWVKIDGAFLMASGRVPIEPNVEFEFTNGQTGGEVIHSLTESEMPRHTHIQNAHNHTQGQHRHDIGSDWATGSGSQGAFTYGTNRNRTTKYTSYATPTINDKTATNKYTGGSGTSESASNGVAHNNMPPYLVVDMWKRTA